MFISQLSPTLESKVISVNERGLTSTQWSVYNTDTKRIRYSSVPTSSITAEAVTVDGFAVSQKDFSGIVTTASRRYTATGMELAHTDGRGNTTTTVTDIAGRSISVTDAAGNVTTTAYCACCDQPATVTDAMGNTTHYRYDIRGRKVAEWGTATQPALFAYDDADNMVSLTTYRNPASDITTDPVDMQGDVTTWIYDLRHRAGTPQDLRRQQLRGENLRCLQPSGDRNHRPRQGQNAQLRKRPRSVTEYHLFGLRHPAQLCLQPPRPAHAGDVTQPIQWSCEYNDTDPVSSTTTTATIIRRMVGGLGRILLIAITCINSCQALHML